MPFGIIGVVSLLFVATAGAIGGQWASMLFADDMVKTIQGMGFRPMRPPDNIDGVGDIYVVDFFGNVKQLTCTLQKRPEFQTGVGGRKILTTVSSSSTSGGVDFDKLKGGSGGENVTQFKIVLDNIRYQKSSLAEVYSAVSVFLSSDKNCQDIIIRYVNEGYCVAPIVSVMIANGRFVKVIQGKGEIEIKKDKNNVYSSAVEIAGSIGFGSNLFIEGRDLHYGVQVSDRCITLGNAIVTRFVPSQVWWLFTPIRNLWHEARMRINNI